MVQLISSLIFNGFVSIVFKYISVFQTLSCTFMGHYRTVLICSTQKTLHYSFTCIPSWDCAMYLCFPLALQKPTAGKGWKTIFWQKSLRWEPCNMHIWPSAFSKWFCNISQKLLIVWTRMSLPYLTMIIVPAELASQPLRSQHRARAPLTPIKSFMYSLECFHHSCVTWAHETKICSVIRLTHRTCKVWTPYVQYF